MRDFNTHREQFDRDFERTRKWGIVVSIITLALVLGIAAFAVWVIVMLLRFFGVV